MKKQLKISIDIAMALLLPMLMAYSLIGEKFHEVVGTVMLVLFIVHHTLNRKWYTALFKGTYNAQRAFQTVLDMLLVGFMVLQPVSGILLSKHLYAFLPVLPVSATARKIHMLLAYWGYALLSVHAGTHLIVLFEKMKRSSKKAWAAAITVMLLVSAYGICAFVKRGFADYMFMRAAFSFFDYSEARICFIMDYLAVMAGFAFLGMFASHALSSMSIRERNHI